MNLSVSIMGLMNFYRVIFKAKEEKFCKNLPRNIEDSLSNLI